MKSLNIYKEQVPILNGNKEISILHLSDLHCSPKRIEIAKRLAEIQNTPIDIMVLTGDVVDHAKFSIQDSILKELQNIKAKHKFFVWGNHDHSKRFSNTHIEDALHRIGFINLTNNDRRLRMYNELIDIYGVDEYYRGKPKTPKIRNKDAVNILLIHNTDGYVSDYPKEFDLILSGHTHGGEFNFGFINGSHYLAWKGSWKNRFGYYVGLKKINERMFSYISPGFSSHYGFRINTIKEGTTILKLQNKHISNR